MKLLNGLVRTPLGFYVLRDDVYLSRVFERLGRLDTNDNMTEITSFAHLIPEGGVAVDAGAFVGDHALTYSQIVGPEGRVYAFEPHPMAYQALQRNMARLSNVVTFQLGLSDCAQSTAFQCELNVGGSFVSMNGGNAQVDLVTLDDFLLPQLTRCDFVHLDAEGLEPRILHGARRFIDAFHPMLLVEVCDKHLRRANTSEKELLQLLDEYGYTATTIPSHLEPELRDVLCIRK